MDGQEEVEVEEEEEEEEEEDEECRNGIIDPMEAEIERERERERESTDQMNYFAASIIPL